MRTFRDLADLNAQAKAWVLKGAGVRCHSISRRSLLELCALEADRRALRHGQSHLALALGHCAVRQGVDVVFTTCAGCTLISPRAVLARGIGALR